MSETISGQARKNQMFNLILASFISLYFEMLVIRWLGSEVRLFSYFKNLIMLAAFLGLKEKRTIGNGSSPCCCCMSRW